MLCQALLHAYEQATMGAAGAGVFYGDPNFQECISGKQPLDLTLWAQLCILLLPLRI